MKTFDRRKFGIVGVSTAFTLSTLSMTVPTTSYADDQSNSAQVWLTDLSTNTYLTQQPDVTFTNDNTSQPIMLAVNEDKQYQPITGFGAAFTDSSAWLVFNKLSESARNNVLQDLFSPTTGIGLSMLRQQMGASDFAVNGNYSYDEMPKGQTDPNLANFSTSHDNAYIIPVLKQAMQINPNLKIVASPWSPPGWMKTSDSMIGGSLKPEGYAPLANYFVKFIQDYQKQGVPVAYITPQNEPLYEPSSYPGMSMPATDQLNFIKNYLGPALKQNHLDTQILAYDHNWDQPGYPETIYSDATAASNVSGTAWHCYGGDVSAQSAVHNAYPNKDAYITECSGGTWQGSDQNAFSSVVDTLIINGMRNWAKSVILWNMALDPNNGPTNNGCLTCRGVVTVDPNSDTAKHTIDYYALGQASKFVKPGAVRIGSNSYGTGSIEDVAFKNPDGSKVLLAFNSSASKQSFKVLWGNQSFQYALNPGAAATFVWHGAPTANNAHYQDYDHTQDVVFHNSDGSQPIVTYNPDNTGGNSALLSGTKMFTYTQPVGASISGSGTETALPRTGWSATASSSDTYGDGPSNVLDGKLSTRWSSGAGQSNGDWFQIDMGAPQTFNQVTMDSGTSTGDYVRSYQVYASNDGVNWGSAVASGYGNGPVVTITLPSQTARFLRIEATGGSGSWWSIGEVNVLTSNSSVSTTNDTTIDSQADTDGAAGIEHKSFHDVNGSKVLVAYNPTSTPQSFQVKLWEQNSLNYTLPAGASATFTWTGTPDSKGAVPSAPTVNSISPTRALPDGTVSLSGSNFGNTQGASTVLFGTTMVPVVSWSNTTIAVAVPHGMAAGDVPVSVIVNGQTSNTVKLTVTSYGTQLPRTGWTATASSSSSDVPSNMLDDNINTRWSSGAPLTNGQWIQIDMGSQQTFSQIVMNSGPSTGDYARGYEVYVSSDGVNWGNPVATGTGNGPVVPVIFSTPQTGRYIKVVQTGESGSWWSIAEFNVYQ